MKFFLPIFLVIAMTATSFGQSASLNTAVNTFEEVDVWCWVGDGGGALDDDADDDRDPTSGTHSTVPGAGMFARVSNLSASANGGDEKSECDEATMRAGYSTALTMISAESEWSIDMGTKTAGYEVEQQLYGEIDNQTSIRYTGGDATEVMIFKMTFTLKRPEEDAIDQWGMKLKGSVGGYNGVTAEYEKANDRWKIHGYLQSSTGTGLPTLFTDYVSASASGTASKTYTVYREQSRDQYENLRTQILADDSADMCELVIDDVNVDVSVSDLLNKVEIKFDSFQ